MVETHALQGSPATVSVLDSHVLPLQLLGDPAVNHFLGGEHGEHTILKGEAHLSAKEGKGPSASFVTFPAASLLPRSVNILHQDRTPCQDLQMPILHSCAIYNND